MDKELLQLWFQNMRKGNKNVSGSLGNLDNPMLAYLAGVYDPNTEFGSQVDTPLLSKYGVSDVPAIQSVLASIQGGADPYSLEADIDALIAENPEFISQTGMQPGTFKDLSKAMLEEYQTGSKPKATWWSKAGLPNPLELYDITNVPMSAETQAQIAGFRAPVADIERTLAQTSAAERAAMGRARQTGSPIAADFEQMSKRIKSAAAKTSGVEASALAKLAAAVKRGEGSIDALTARYMPKNKRAQEVYNQQIGRVQKDTQRTGGIKMTVDASSDAFKEAQRKSIERGFLQQQLADQRRKEEAARKGALEATRALGRTPTGDALKQMMQFVAQSK